MSKQNAVIIDLDNCLSDDGWRMDLIKRDEPDAWKRYVNYHMQCDKDTLGNGDALALPTRMYDLVGSIPLVLISTARPVAFHFQTMSWLRRRDIKWHQLNMRADNDHRPSVEIKQERLTNWRKRFDIIAACDDCPAIVEMYRQAGVPYVFEYSCHGVRP
jgi:hypothetical protein